MAERERIVRFFAPLAASDPDSFNLTDDAALLNPPPGQSVVVTTDSVIEGIHVLPQATPEQYAQKLVRRNLSDLAAMGALPWRYTLNMHTPGGLADEWFAAFTDALAKEQRRFGMVLVGGDSTSGGENIHLTMSCFGLVEGAPLRRNGATIGDDIYVSGTIGMASFVLQLLLQNQPVEDALAAYYHCPEPRLALGYALRGIASSAIDISDGLLADAHQLSSASNAGMALALAYLPLLPLLQDILAQQPSIWRFPLNGGDDYELLFTAPETMRETIAQLAEQVGLPLTLIGKVIEGTGVALVDEKGEAMEVTAQGYEHR